MTDTTTPTALGYAREHADKSWQMFAREKTVTDTRPVWEESVTPDGSLLLSGRIVGQRPVWALARFARDFWLTLKPGDLRPQFDTSVPGRTVLVWRYDGVWVELWHPDSAVDTQTATSTSQTAEVAEADVPTPIPVAARRAFLRGPSGRLTFTRRKKETNTA
jgi:hypothetical protein